MPAVLVHGVPDTHRMWATLLGLLDRADVVTPSLPGFGVPVPAGFDASKEAYVDWLVAELEAIGEPVDLVGHDWGSFLVQRVASIRPDLVRTWCVMSAFIDPDYVWHDVAQLWQTPEVGEQVMTAFIPETLPVAMADSGLPAAALAEMASHVDDTMRRCILALYRSAVHVVDEWTPALTAAKGQRPALVLAGAADPYVPAAFAERLAARVGGAVMVVDGCGHWVPVEAAALVADALPRLWATG